MGFIPGPVATSRMITSRRMAAVDRNAAALGIPTRVLMESAGSAVADAVRRHAGDGDNIAIVAGRGDNGGDALVTARFIDDLDATVHLVGDPEAIQSEASGDAWAALEACELDRVVYPDSSDIDPFEADIIVDGLLGTGIQGSVREPIKSAIEAINASDATVIAVDIPSGVDSDTGEIASVAVSADHVVTFHDRKPAHASIDVTVTVADIGIPDAADRFVGPGDAMVLGGRVADAHKGAHGRVLVVGGGPFSGAPALTGLAALRAGADLAEVATPETVAPAVAGYSPDLIVHPLDGAHLAASHVETLASAIERADVLAIGPGLGDHPDTVEAVGELLAADVSRIVVDADGLAALAGAAATAEVIATPHAGEFADMGFDRPAHWREAETAVADAARSLDATVLLKGPYDVISDGERTAVNRTGNPGMTVGGTGDVLTGVTAALAHRAPPIEAAAVAAWATGRAGDACLNEIGIGFLASDVLDRIPGAMALDR